MESANRPTIQWHTVQIRADMIKYTTETQSTMAHFKVLLQKVSGGTKGTMKNISQYSLPPHQKLILGPFEYNSTCHLTDWLKDSLAKYDLQKSTSKYQNMAVPCNRSSADDRWTTLDFCSCFNVWLRKKCLTVLIIGDLLSGAVLIMAWQILTRDCTISSEMFAFAWNRQWYNVLKI